MLQITPVQLTQSQINPDKKKQTECSEGISLRKKCMRQHLVLILREVSGLVSYFRLFKQCFLYI